MERDCRAAVQGALDDNLPAMHLHQVFDDREPEPGSSQFSGTRLIRPVEPLTQPGNVAFQNANARVGDPDDQIPLHAGRCRDGDRSP
jgi:hypothetical protein